MPMFGSKKFADSVASEMTRSEEHTSELQSHHELVCRLLLEKKNADLGIVLHAGEIRVILVSEGAVPASVETVAREAVGPYVAGGLQERLSALASQRYASPDL